MGDDLVSSALLSIHQTLVPYTQEWFIQLTALEIEEQDTGTWLTLVRRSRWNAAHHREYIQVRDPTQGSIGSREQYIFKRTNVVPKVLPDPILWDSINPFMGVEPGIITSH